MATIKKRVEPRKRARVTESERPRNITKAVDAGTVTVMENGNLEIAVQASESVPVAQYANVMIGPVGLRWQAANPGIAKLGVVDWDDPELDEEQQAIYDTVRGWLRATGKLCEHHIAEDREIVEESVRLHNEREAAEEAAAAKKAKSTRRRRS